MLSGGRGIDSLDRLDVRLVALLGLALLPIGIIAMVQTYRVIDEADRKAEAALVGATLSAAATERERILRVRGATQLGAAVMSSLMDDPERCSRDLTSFVESNQATTFAGLVGIDGSVLCASSGVGTDLSNSEIYLGYYENRKPSITAVKGAISRRSVIVITEPIVQNGVDRGYLAISVPQRPLIFKPKREGELAPLFSLTFTPEGDFLITRENAISEETEASLPAGRSLASLTGSEPITFVDRSQSGEMRVYSTAPLIPGEIYAMSVWPVQAIQTSGLTAASAILFPLLMWLVTIGVAYFAVHSLVVRHIRLLRLRIRAFTANRKIIAADPDSDAPSEVREVIESFHQMTERIVRDEAELENSLQEKDVLLKEVHHRVKNNLQLISSMINMQLRKSKSPEIGRVLRRLQDRILGLATIHRNLYQASVLSRIDSGQLVSDLVDQVMRSSDLSEKGVEADVDVENVPLYPDQAVPLSLLATEAITNAVRYLGENGKGAPWISMSLRSQDDGSVMLQVSNSTGPAMTRESHVHDSGLGSQLIAAFVMQLDAKYAVSETEDSHHLEVVFQPGVFTAEI